MEAIFSLVDNNRHSLPSVGPSDSLTLPGVGAYQGAKLSLKKVAPVKKPSFASVKACQVIFVRQQFVLILTKCLLAFGAPTHRIESQLAFASKTLGAKAIFVYIPGLVIVTFNHSTAGKTQVIRCGGRISLSALHKVHVVFRHVLRGSMTVEDGCTRLRDLLKHPPMYGRKLRCFLAFICASIICVIAFGGSVLDMGFSGLFAAILTCMGIHTASKNALYGNVYEICISILVSFISRGLGTAPHHFFCFSAISSAGIVALLPGFTILISALELTSTNIFCGSVRLVYAIIYTLFLGFGLTIGSDLYVVIDKHARRMLEAAGTLQYTMVHGIFESTNTSFSLNGPFVFGFADPSAKPNDLSQQGCFRDPSWPWWRQPIPWWTLFFLVPAYSICSSLANFQHWRSRQLLVMTTFSCLAFLANNVANNLLPNRGDIVSGAGAFAIGLLGNFYSRLARGTAFTSMVTGVLLLVPSGVARGGGLLSSQPSMQQYTAGFDLAIRMMEVSIGITIGLFASQMLVYFVFRGKDVKYFAF